jgi:uncharacterized protein
MSSAAVLSNAMRICAMRLTAMSEFSIPIRADDVLAILRGHEAELRAAGIRRLSLFGSVARGDAGPESDVDLLAELDPAAPIGLLELVRLERHIGELVGHTVDLITEPIQKPRLRANITRDSKLAF